MSTIAEQLQEAADKATQASAQADTWATGPDNTTVPTDSGPVPTIAEFNRAAQARVDASIEAIGWVLAGDFTAGCTVTDRNQYVLVVGGAGYRWDGVLPKVVAPGSSPAPIAMGSWVLVGDMSLRGEFASIGGYNLIGTPSGSIKEVLSERWVNSGADKKEIIFDLPLLFPDYNAILAANPTWTYIYPGSFDIGDDGRIYIAYGPSDNSSTKRFVVVYSSTGAYLGYWQTDNGGTGVNGPAVSEGIVVTAYYGGLRMYLGSYDGNIFQYDISSASFGGSLTHSASHQTGLYNQFSFLNGTWAVEQAVPSIGQIRQRNVIAFFDAAFSPTGFAEVNPFDAGYITSATTAYGPLMNKRQGFCLAPSMLVCGYGGVFITGTTTEAPTNYQGVKGFNLDGGKVVEFMALPSGFISALNAAGKPSTRIENEGVSYHEGNVYSLWINTDRSQPTATTSGVLITKEYSFTPNLDLSSAIARAPSYNSALMSSGVFPRVGDGAVLQNPITGASMPSITDVMDFMRLAGQKNITIYTSSTPLNDFAGAPYPSGTSVVVSTLNNLSFDVTVTQADKKTFLRTVFSDPTYSVGDALILEGKRIAIDGVDSGSLALNRVTARTFGLDTSVEANQVLVIDQQAGATANTLIIGGASAAFRSATTVSFATNVNPAATGGTIRWRIDETSFRPFTDNAYSVGNAILRPTVVFAMTGSINTSDASEKTAPQAIDEALLDAADDISIDVWKWLSSIKEKGEDSARWHFGPIAQQVRDAFAKHGLDGCDYGLLCYDKWDDQFEDEVAIRENENGHIEEYSTGRRTLVIPAGDRWGIRPDQCLWLLAAAGRRRAQRAESRLEVIEQRLSELEAK